MWISPPRWTWQKCDCFSELCLLLSKIGLFIFKVRDNVFTCKRISITCHVCMHVRELEIEGLSGLVQQHGSVINMGELIWFIVVDVSTKSTPIMSSMEWEWNDDISCFSSHQMLIMLTWSKFYIRHLKIYSLQNYGIFSLKWFFFTLFLFNYLWYKFLHWDE